MKFEIYYDDLKEEYKEICDCIGLNAFITMCEYFNGENVYIPRVDMLRKPERNRALIRDYLNGMKTSVLVNKYRMSDRQVRKVINQYEMFSVV